jgi:hypothetical protein
MKYYLSIAAIFKNETWGMQEWLDHHLAHGVEHFYLVNDGSTDDYMSILSPYIQEGKVTLYQNDIIERYTDRQIHINNKYFLPILKESQWVANIDLDEYLYSTDTLSLKDALRCYENFGSVYVRWAYYTSNGHITQPKGIVESFTTRCELGAVVYCRAPDDTHPKYIRSDEPKVIMNSNYPTTSLNIHNTATQGIPISGSHNFPQLLINHYQLQSREYWETIKMNRGDVNHWFKGHPRNFELYDAFDAAGIVQDTRLRDQNRALFGSYK